MKRRGRVRQVRAFGAEWSYVLHRSRLIKYLHMASVIMDEVERLGGRVKVLDCGSGKGRLTWYCRAPEKWSIYKPSMYCKERSDKHDSRREELFKQIDLYGLDVDFKRMRQANSQGCYKMAMGDMDVGLPYADNTFDIVVSSHVLEHIGSPETGVSEMYRILKPGGMIVVGVPTYDPVLRIFRIMVGPILDAYFKFRKGQTTGHETHFTIRSVRRLLKYFDIEEIKGFRMGRGQLLIFLEDSRLLYDLNRLWGKHLPTFSPEINVVARKST